MDNLKVFFTNQIDTESKGIEVFHKNSLIAKGHLNLCSNWAHVDLLEEFKQAFEDMQHEIETVIENRQIIDNRIHLNN
tara:strand:+ start:502 stop:735 length:234 start_codon:yes stop_codon:yes gene_type:complete